MMAGARGRAARGVREVPARHALPVARGGADALRAKDDARFAVTAAARSPTSSTSPTRCTRSRSRWRRTSTGHCRKRRSRRSRSRRRRPRSSPHRSKEASAMRGAWSRPLAGLSPRASTALWAASFIVPVLAWCAISYLPFVWHPMVRVTDPGDVAWMTPGLLVDRAAFAAENAEVAARSGRPADRRRRPIRSSCRAPHAVAARAGHRLHHAARPARGAVAAPEPVAQHPGHLLGLPAVVDHRRAAGHPVRRAARRWGA